MDKFKVQITKEFTDEEMEDIVVTALEGGIGYWACLDNTTPEFKDEPKDTPTAVWCWHLLKKGKGIRFIDAEDTEEGETWWLTLPMLLNGIKLSSEKGYWNGDIDTMDANDADIVFQLSMFGEIVYG